MIRPRKKATDVFFLWGGRRAVARDEPLEESRPPGIEAGLFELCGQLPAQSWSRGHHSLYAVELDAAVWKVKAFRERNPGGAASGCLYVGVTGLPPETRFERHLAGDAVQPLRPQARRQAAARPGRGVLAAAVSDRSLHGAEAGGVAARAGIRRLAELSRSGSGHHSRMANAQETLTALMRDGRVRATPGAWLSSAPLGSCISWDRVEGMLLGLAIGDALGNTTEGMLPQQRRERLGEIRDYRPNRYTGDRAVGLPSDDSQMAFWTLDELTTAGRLDPEALAKRFVSHRIFGIGHSVNQFVLNHAIQQKPWHEAGVESAGNGALMRIAPVVVPYLRSPSSDLWADAVLATMVTHNDSAAIAAERRVRRAAVGSASGANRSGARSV